MCTFLLCHRACISDSQPKPSAFQHRSVHQSILFIVRAQDHSEEEDEDSEDDYDTDAILEKYFVKVSCSSLLS